MKNIELQELISNFFGDAGAKIMWRKEKEKNVGTYQSASLAIEVEIRYNGYVIRMLRPTDMIGKNLELFNLIPGCKSIQKNTWGGLESDKFSVAQANCRNVIERIERYYRVLGCIGPKSETIYSLKDYIMLTSGK